MKMWVKSKHEFHYWDINKNVFIQEKNTFFYTRFLDPIRAYFFRNSVLSLKEKNETKQTSVYFPSFPSCIPIHLLNFTAKSGKHLLLRFLPLSFAEQPSFIWISPTPLSQLWCKGYQWCSWCFTQGDASFFIPLTFRRCVETLSPRLGVHDVLRCTSPPPSLSLPQWSPSQLPPLHPTAEVQSPLDSFRLGLSSLSPCVLSPSNIILYQDFNDHLTANDSKSRPLVQISELQNYIQSFLWDPPLLDTL